MLCNETSTNDKFFISDVTGTIQSENCLFKHISVLNSKNIMNIQAEFLLLKLGYAQMIKRDIIQTKPPT